MKVVHANQFFHDGRGPELVRVHIANNSSHLLAIDFYTPDAVHDSDHIKHLRFVNAQSYMFIPEEVHNYSLTEVDWSKTEKGALISLGQSSWLNSFSPRHLDNCEHFRAMFYDEFLDVICESVQILPGSYQNGL
jgi:hypothetical protein